MRKLDEIVREYYIEELGMSQLDERYPRILQIALSGLKELNYDIKNIVTEKILTVNDNDTVDLPSNYIDYLTIGLVDGGVIKTFGLNNSMAVRDTDACGDIATVVANTSAEDGGGFDYNTSNYTQDGQYAGRAFGIGGGGNSSGTYKIYKDLGYISLNSVSATEIILRYIATLEQVDGNFMVDEYLVEAIKTWINLKYIRASRSRGLGDKEQAMRSFEKARKKAMLRSNRFSITEFVNAFRTGYRSAPGI